MRRQRSVNTFPIVQVAWHPACPLMALLLVYGNISSAASPVPNANILLVLFIRWIFNNACNVSGPVLNMSYQHEQLHSCHCRVSCQLSGARDRTARRSTGFDSERSVATPNSQRKDKHILGSDKSAWKSLALLCLRAYGESRGGRTGWNTEEQTHEEREPAMPHAHELMGEQNWEA